MYPLVGLASQAQGYVNKEQRALSDAPSGRLLQAAARCEQATTGLLRPGASWAGFRFPGASWAGPRGAVNRGPLEGAHGRGSDSPIQDGHKGAWNRRQASGVLAAPTSTMKEAALLTSA